MFAWKCAEHVRRTWVFIHRYNIYIYIYYFFISTSVLGRGKLILHTPRVAGDIIKRSCRKRSWLWLPLSRSSRSHDPSGDTVDWKKLLLPRYPPLITQCAVYIGSGSRYIRQWLCVCVCVCVGRRNHFLYLTELLRSRNPLGMAVRLNFRVRSCTYIIYIYTHIHLCALIFVYIYI